MVTYTLLLGLKFILHSLRVWQCTANRQHEINWKYYHNIGIILIPWREGRWGTLSCQVQVLESQSGIWGFSHSLLPVPVAKRLRPQSRPRRAYLTHQESNNVPSEDKGWSLEPRVSEQRMVKFIKQRGTDQDKIQEGNQANTGSHWLLFLLFLAFWVWAIFL